MSNDERNPNSEIRIPKEIRSIRLHLISARRASDERNPNDKIPKASQFDAFVICHSSFVLWISRTSDLWSRLFECSRYWFFPALKAFGVGSSGPVLRKTLQRRTAYANFKGPPSHKAVLPKVSIRCPTPWASAR